jgi:hypothetical protein
MPAPSECRYLATAILFRDEIGPGDVIKHAKFEAFIAQYVPASQAHLHIVGNVSGIVPVSNKGPRDSFGL